MDLRGSPRVAIAELWVGLPNGDLSVQGNVSVGGIGFILEQGQSVKVGDPLAIRITIPESGEPLAMSAIVCHVRYDERLGRTRVGAKFVGLDELVQAPLERFVEETALLYRTSDLYPTPSTL